MTQENTQEKEEFTEQEQMDLDENEHDCNCGSVDTNTFGYVDIQRDISLRTQLNFLVEMSYMTVIGILLIAIRSDNINQFDNDTGLLSMLVMCNIAFFFLRHNYLSKKYEINS
jgi:hypothetical protein